MYKKILIILALLTSGFILFRFTGIWQIVSSVSHLQAWIKGLGVWGYAAYMSIYILCTIFMVPGSVLTIAAGVIFGPLRGGIMAIFSATLGAGAAFLTARYAVRDFIALKIQNSPFWDKLDKKVAEHGINILILTRLLPIFPFNLQNYAYGITNIPFAAYLIVSFITMLPGTFIYAYLAGEILKNGVSLVFLIKFAIAGLLLFLLSFIPKVIAAKKKINLQTIDQI